MKKNGFTLIELLAVIIILAIIALIAVPSVLNLIEKSKDGALEVSAKGYIEGINECIMSERLVGNNITSNKVKELNALCSNYLKGNLPTDGTVKIEDGIITEYSLVFGDKMVNQNGDFESAYAVGKPVYFNPVDGEMCDNYVDSNSLNNNKTGCMKWYIIGENSNTIDVILDHNTTNIVAWNSSGSVSPGPLTLLTQLHTDTDGWTGVPERTDTYTDPLSRYEINYSGYRARLIDANEIAKITGADKALQWNPNEPYISGYYLDGKYGTDSTWQTQVATSQGASKYEWLFNYTNNCTSYGCNVASSGSDGYWTANALGLKDAWGVTYNGFVKENIVDGGDVLEIGVYLLGLRPVITIPKP